jgi:hypothetical protein
MVPRVGFEPTRLKAGNFEFPVYYQFHHRGIDLQVFERVTV